MKKKQRKIKNRIILLVISILATYIIAFNNSLDFLIKIGIQNIAIIRAIIFFASLVFVISWTALKTQKGEL